jgi:hypothetical protein
MPLQYTFETGSFNMDDIDKFVKLAQKLKLGYLFDSSEEDE